MKNNEQNPPRCGRNLSKRSSPPPLSALYLKSYKPIPRTHYRRRTNTGRTGGVRRNG